MSLDFVTERFTLERVVKGPAGLDPDKLLSYQEHWMAKRSTAEKVDGCLPYLVKAKYIGNPIEAADVRYVTHLVEALGERLKLFSDILQYDEYFVSDADLTFDEKAFDKRLRKPEEAASLLRAFREHLAVADSFDAQSLDALLHQWVEEQEIKVGQVIHALRVATTGKPAGPGMFDCLALLGKDRCVARIDRALELI